MAHTPSTFGDRFGYARWLLLLGRDELPSFAEIGRAVGRTGQAVSAWTAADEAPPGPLEFYDRLAAVLEVDMRWLIRGQGDAPQPALWAIWCDYRDRRTEARATTEPTPAERGGTKATAAELARHHAVAKSTGRPTKGKNRPRRSA